MTKNMLTKVIKSLTSMQKDVSKYQEIALMALTFFCGIRVEEVLKCEWSQIQKRIKPKEVDETSWRIIVWGDQEKTDMTKVNPIPENAKYWLAAAEKH